MNPAPPNAPVTRCLCGRAIEGMIPPATEAAVDAQESPSTERRAAPSMRLMRPHLERC